MTITVNAQHKATTASSLPKLAVWKFTSCDGCQLSLLDCEDELLLIADNIDIAYFMEASSHQVNGPYELSIVEGSITTADEAARIQQIRQQSQTLITIGACASSGGIQALRNFADVDDYTAVVYARPDYIATLKTSTAISDHVQVDFVLEGCPINKAQLLEVLSAYLNRRKPQIPNHSVCLECKLKGNVCVMVAHGTPCMGPVTHAGCGAICPSYNRGCYACYGPKENTNAASMSDWWQTELNSDQIQLIERFRHINAAAPAFAKESLRLSEADATTQKPPHGTGNDKE